jgi:hypothetical protein
MRKGSPRGLASASKKRPNVNPTVRENQMPYSMRGIVGPCRPTLQRVVRRPNCCCRIMKLEIECVESGVSVLASLCVPGRVQVGGMGLIAPIASEIGGACWLGSASRDTDNCPLRVGWGMDSSNQKKAAPRPQQKHGRWRAEEGQLAGRVSRQSPRKAATLLRPMRACQPKIRTIGAALTR